MKHARLLIILSAAVAVAFAALVFVALFSVKDISVSYSVYGDEMADVSSVLKKYEGANLLLLNVSDVEKDIKDNFALKVDSIEKVFPSSLKIVLSSRQERFAIAAEGGYYIVDEEYAVVAKRQTPQNSADALDNVIVRFDVAGDVPIAEYKQLACDENAYLKAFKATFDEAKSPRDDICEALVYETEERGNVRITLKTRLGVEIVIFKALEDTAVKAKAAFEKFSSLAAEDKLCGKIECYMRTDGTVSAVYTTRN